VIRKQTYKELAQSNGVSESTIKRKLRLIKVLEAQNTLPQKGVLLMDTTYWGRNWGVLVILDSQTENMLWRKFVSKERLADYREGVSCLESRGYIVESIVCDGLKGMFQMFAMYKLQMCQFHQVAIVRRYITTRPKLEAAKELKEIIKMLTKTDKESFYGVFNDWLKKWDLFLKERTIDSVSGKSRYVHRKLRSAYLSIKRNLPYLFVWYDNPELHIPNTNNKLEGTFTALKNKLRNHNGLSKENRKRFIDEFFKA
jgi:hypothetical protein